MGANPAPDVDGWGSLYVDGLKLILIGLIYVIPVIIISLAPIAFLPAKSMATAPVGKVVRDNGL